MVNDFKMYRLYKGEEISHFKAIDQNPNMFWYYEKVLEEQYQK
jgi:hypothetical protein